MIVKPRREKNERLKIFGIEFSPDPWANFIAKNANGLICLYEFRPRLNRDSLFERWEPLSGRMSVIGTNQDNSDLSWWESCFNFRTPQDINFGNEDISGRFITGSGDVLTLGRKNNVQFGQCSQCGDCHQCYILRNHSYHPHDKFSDGVHRSKIIYARVGDQPETNLTEVVSAEENVFTKDENSGYYKKINLDYYLDNIFNPLPWVEDGEKVWMVKGGRVSHVTYNHAEHAELLKCGLIHNNYISAASKNKMLSEGGVDESTAIKFAYTVSHALHPTGTLLKNRIVVDVLDVNNDLHEYNKLYVHKIGYFEENVYFNNVDGANKKFVKSCAVYGDALCILAGHI